MILNAMMTKWEIKVNWGETKAMAVKRGEMYVMVSVKSEQIEEVSWVYNEEVYVYIGAMFDKEGSGHVRMKL